MSGFIPIEFQKAFEKTKQPALSLTATYTDSPQRVCSQFGGIPYWPADCPPPVAADGKQLVLLAQLNFTDMPEHTELPSAGILQFFIPRDDEQYGANTDEIGGASKMVTHFWPAPHDTELCEWPDDSHEDDLTPVFGAHRLTFSVRDDYAGIDTIECAEALAANPFEVLEDVALNDKEETAFFDAITEFTASHGHKLLGYPYFIHEEPRDTSDYRLLLQIDTDMNDDNDIMWGDNGVGQIFIPKGDLAQHKFDNCWLYWDC